LIAEMVLKRDKGATIFYDLRSSWAVKELILANGGKPMMSRVGIARTAIFQADKMDRTWHDMMYPAGRDHLAVPMPILVTPPFAVPSRLIGHLEGEVALGQAQCRPIVCFQQAPGAILGPSLVDMRKNVSLRAERERVFGMVHAPRLATGGQLLYGRGQPVGRNKIVAVEDRHIASSRAMNAEIPGQCHVLKSNPVQLCKIGRVPREVGVGRGSGSVEHRDQLDRKVLCGESRSAAGAAHRAMRQVPFRMRRDDNGNAAAVFAHEVSPAAVA